jgi:undecaprenyl-phosphate galactose phosphotransferase
LAFYTIFVRVIKRIRLKIFSFIEVRFLLSDNVKKIANFVALLFVDLLAFYASLFTAFLTRKMLPYLFPAVPELLFSLNYFLKSWWLAFIFLFFIVYERLYFIKYSFWDETYKLLKAVTFAIIGILALVSLGKMTDQVSRLTILLLWFYGLFLFPLFRLAGKHALYRAGLWKENIIIIGAGQAGVEAAQGLQSQTYLGYNLIGFLDDADDKIGTSIEIKGTTYKVFGKTKNFKKFINKLGVSTIIIAMPSLPVDQLAKLTNHVQKFVRNILLIPDVKGIALANTELQHLFVQQLFLLKINNNLKSTPNRFIKRTFDMTVSILSLPVLIPFIGILGVLIKLDSPGPVFYRHTRIGLHGRPFSIFKFRSMHCDAEKRLGDLLASCHSSRGEWETFCKLKDDPRVTRMGKFLRFSSLDELPQLFNVLKGEMSLVGPRPVLLEEIAKYYKEHADYYHLVRPGITGLWQVSGRNNIDYTARVRLDSWYVLNWSLWLDIVMLFKTVRVVLKRDGAY